MLSAAGEEQEDVLREAVLSTLLGLVGRESRMVRQRQGVLVLEDAVAARLSAGAVEATRRILSVGYACKQLRMFAEGVLFHASPGAHTLRERSSGLYMRALAMGVRDDVLQGLEEVVRGLEEELRGEGRVPPLLARVSHVTAPYHMLIPVLAQAVEEIETERVEGAKILDVLHRHANTGMPFVREQMERVLARVYKVLLNQMLGWMSHGLLLDPHAEFFVRGPPTSVAVGGASSPALSAPASAAAVSRHSTVSHYHTDNMQQHTRTRAHRAALLSSPHEASGGGGGGGGVADTVDASVGAYVIRASMLPLSLVPVSLAQKVLFIGKAVQILHIANEAPRTLPAAQTPSFLKRWGALSAHAAMNNVRLEELVEELHTAVSTGLQHLLVGVNGFPAHIRAIRSLFLLGRGELFRFFLEALQAVEDTPPALNADAELNDGALRFAARQSHLDEDELCSMVRVTLNPREYHAEDIIMPTGLVLVGACKHNFQRRLISMTPALAAIARSRGWASRTAARAQPRTSERREAAAVTSLSQLPRAFDRSPIVSSAVWLQHKKVVAHDFECSARVRAQAEALLQAANHPNTAPGWTAEAGVSVVLQDCRAHVLGDGLSESLVHAPALPNCLAATVLLQVIASPLNDAPSAQLPGAQLRHDPQLRAFLVLTKRVLDPTGPASVTTGTTGAGGGIARWRGREGGVVHMLAVQEMPVCATRSEARRLALEESALILTESFQLKIETEEAHPHSAVDATHADMAADDDDDEHGNGQKRSPGGVGVAAAAAGAAVVRATVCVHVHTATATVPEHRENLLDIASVEHHVDTKDLYGKNGGSAWVGVSSGSTVLHPPQETRAATTATANAPSSSDTMGQDNGDANVNPSASAQSLSSRHVPQIAFELCGMHLFSPDRWQAGVVALPELAARQAELVAHMSHVLHARSGWSDLSLHYAFPWALQLLLTPDSMEQYNRLFTFLLHVKRVEYHLEQLWPMFMHTKYRLRSTRDQRGMHLVWYLRHAMSFFVNNLIYYLQVDVVDIQVTELLEFLDETIAHPAHPQVANSHGHTPNRGMTSTPSRIRKAAAVSNTRHVSTFDQIARAHRACVAGLRRKSFVDIPAVQQSFIRVLGVCNQFCALFSLADDIAAVSQNALRAILTGFHAELAFLFSMLQSTDAKELVLRLDYNGMYSRIWSESMGR